MGLDDPGLLELATSEERILVTHNVRDFPEILRSWAEEQRHHAGCIIVVGIALHQFGAIAKAIEGALALSADQGAWIDRAAFAPGPLCDPR